MKGKAVCFSPPLRGLCVWGLRMPQTRGSHQPHWVTLILGLKRRKENFRDKTLNIDGREFAFILLPLKKPKFLSELS